MYVSRYSEEVPEEKSRICTSSVELKAKKENTLLITWSFGVSVLIRNMCALTAARSIYELFHACRSCDISPPLTRLCVCGVRRSLEHYQLSDWEKLPSCVTLPEMAELKPCC